MLRYEYSRPIPSESDSTGAIAGGVVGGVAGLCLLMLLVLAVLAFIFNRKRLMNQHRELKQPDYEQLAYGDVLDASLSRKQAAVHMFLEGLIKPVPIEACFCSITHP